MIEINNLTKVKIDENFLRKAAEEILKKEKKSLELSIALVNPKIIRKLNREYRKKDKTTDILSFSYNGAGELIICPRQIGTNAKKFGINFKKELTQVLIHGILHLLGGEHEASEEKAKIMKQKEEDYLRQFKI